MINDTVRDINATFDYEVSVGSSTGGDPDLYVSLNDGRHPTLSDYDFHSAQFGADTVRISSESDFWDFKNHNTQAGVLMVVGVRFREAGNYTLLLTSKGGH